MANRPSVSPSGGSSAHLGHALRKRHVTMISLGGTIGAGLFVGSSATIGAMGPAACLSYLLAGIVVLFVMRMLGEMALAHPGVGSFTEFTRLGLGNWAGFTNGWLYWYFWVIVAAIAGVLIAMGFERSLASQLLASLGSLGVVSIAYWLTRWFSRRSSDSAMSHESATGRALGVPAAQGKS